MQTSNENFEELKQLEESLWIAETRFDKKYTGWQLQFHQGTATK